MSEKRTPSTVSDAAPALRCRSLVKRYGSLIAVNGIDLDIAHGECFGLLGPNGAGKTTTVEIFEGLNRPDSGTVELLGCDWSSTPEHLLRERLGIQLQETQLPEKLTVTEIVRLFRSFYSQGHEPADVIDRVGLNEKARTRVGKLSGGQKQRLALACSLVGKPDILFLDEPTTGLDPQARLKIWEIVEDFRSGGGTILLTTHYMDEAERLCDKLAIMDHGKIISRGSPLELINSLGAEKVIKFSVDEGRKVSGLESLASVASVETREAEYFLSVNSISKAMPELLELLRRQGIEPRTMATRQATLEDVFVSLTGRMLRDE